MTLHVKVFGVEFLTFEAEWPDLQPETMVVSAVDRGVKRLSNWWVKTMSR